MFAVDGGGSVVGSVIAWYDMRGEERVASLHWLVVEESRQRQGIGRALLRRAMNFYRTRGETCVYLHTQPWSWRACLLYAAEGFRWQKRDTFAGYENQFGAASETLRNVLPADAYAVLLASAEE